MRVHLDRVAHPVFDPVDAGERRHDAAHAVPPDRCCIGRHVDLRELVPTRHRDALVDRVTLQVPRLAHVGSGGRVVVLSVAVTCIVLRGGQDMVGCDRRSPIALQAVNDRFQSGDQCGVLAEALVRAAPPLISCDANARSEAPRDSGRAYLLCGGLTDLLQRAGSRVAPRPMLCGKTVAP